MSLLIASRAFDGALLDQAKVGVLATAVISPLVSAINFCSLHRARGEAAQRWTARSLAIPDLAVEVDPARDHIRGRADAPVTLLGYGSFGCRYSSAAASVIPDLLDRFGDQVRCIYRHLPLTDIEPNAQLAAEAVRLPASKAPSGRCTIACQARLSRSPSTRSTAPPSHWD